MIPRDGINRRQVTQLKNLLVDNSDVTALAGEFNCTTETIFRFAKVWKIKLKDTPESLKIKQYEDLIEAEVERRIKTRQQTEREPKKPETKKSLSA